MCKSLFALSLMVCWPALASLAPLVSNDATVVEPRTGWLVSHLAPLGLTSQPHVTDDSTLWHSPAEGLLVELSGVVPRDPSLSIQADDPFQDQPPALSGGTSPPGKLAFFLIFMIGAVIRFLTSSTFHDFVVDVYSPLAPY